MKRSGISIPLRFKKSQQDIILRLPVQIPFPLKNSSWNLKLSSVSFRKSKDEPLPGCILPRHISPHNSV